MIYKILTLILAVLLCLSLLFSKELSIEKALKERENVILKEEKFKLRKEYEDIIKTKDKEYYNAFKTAQEKANRFEALAIQSQKELKHEKAKHRTFSDATIDSLILSIR